MEAYREAARVALGRIYEQVEADLADRPGLVCRLSGLCCRFEEAGHQLFLTSLEYAEMVARGGRRAGPGVVCPWLDGWLCANREGRALACRTYFCSNEAEAAAVTERWHREIRRLHDRLGLPYGYRPLARHLNPDASISSEEV